MTGTKKARWLAAAMLPRRLAGAQTWIPDQVRDDAARVHRGDVNGVRHPGLDGLDPGSMTSCNCASDSTKASASTARTGSPWL